MKQIPPTQARETLGVMQAPSGDESAEVHYLRKKVKIWLGKLWVSNLQKMDVMKATHMTIMHTIRYRLVATALDYEQCDVITGELLSGVLPKMGIVCTASKVLVTAEKAFWGFRLTHVYVLQLVDHLKVLCNL